MAMAENVVPFPYRPELSLLNFFVERIFGVDH